MQPIDERIQQIYDNIATYQAIALNDYGVPEWQALPVASATELAFRPACTQVEPVWQADGSTAWVWQDQAIYTAPGQLQASPETLLNLQAAGVCITGSHAVDVPLVQTDAVYQEFQRQVIGSTAVLGEGSQAGQLVQTEPPVETEQPVEVPSPGINWGVLIPIAVGVIALGFLARYLAGKQANRRVQKSNFTQAEPAPETPVQPTALEQEYDFQL